MLVCLTCYGLSACFLYPKTSNLIVEYSDYLLMVKSIVLKGYLPKLSKINQLK